MLAASSLTAPAATTLITVSSLLVTVLDSQLDGLLLVQVGILERPYAQGGSS
jgi:hypothetical protein